MEILNKIFHFYLFYFFFLDQIFFNFLIIEDFAEAVIGSADRPSENHLPSLISLIFNYY
jgi:hypothetical protein